MVHKRNTVYILPAILMLFSCSAGKEQGYDSIHGGKRTITINAISDKAMSKVTLDEYSVLWAPGDAFAVYDAYASKPENIRENSDFTLLSGEGTVYGKFSGTLIEGEAVSEERTFYALYPASAAENGIYSISTAQEQTGTKDPDKLGSYALMWGEPVTIGADELPTDENMHFTFHHLTSVLDLEVSNIPEGELVSKVSVSGNATDGSYEAPFVSALKVAPGTTGESLSDNSSEYPAIAEEYFKNSVSVTLTSVLGENFTASIMILPRDNVKFGDANHRAETRDLEIGVTTVDANGKNMKTYVLDKQGVPTGSWAEGHRYPVSVDMTEMQEKIDPPVVQDQTNSMDYEYRVVNTTVNSAVLKAKIVQGFHPSLEYGFMFGTDPENLEERPCANMDAAGNFELTVDGLQSGVEYYVIPYAENTIASASADMITFRAAVSGGSQYEFDPDAPADGDSHTRLRQNETALVYWELEPIETTGSIYYFLDRNLGATEVFTETNYSKGPVTNQTSTWQSVGYYYRFNFPVPSATPDMMITTNIDARYGWQSQGTATEETKGKVWTNNVCPEGYVIPTEAQFQEILEYFGDNNSFENLHSVLKVGVTGIRASGKGGFIGAGLEFSPTFSGLWSANAAQENSGFASSFAINTCVKNDATQLNPPMIIAKSRFNGQPVRCVRVVEKQQ